MMTLSKINDLISIQKRPFLQLKYKSGHQFENAGTYNCENIDKETGTEEEKISNAKEWLKRNVELFNPSTVFLVYLKNAQNASSGGVSGPFEFMINEEEADKVKTTQPVQGLSGIQQESTKPPSGYIHESELKAAILEKQLEFEKERAQRELKEMENRFNDKLEAVMESTKDYSMEKLTQLANAIGAIFGKKLNPGNVLSGAEKEPSLKEVAAQEFAQLLVEKLPLSEIQKLKNQVEAFGQETKENKTENPQTDE